MTNYRQGDVLLIKAKAIPAEAKDPRHWPAAMQAEWADDQGTQAAAHHRAALVAYFQQHQDLLDTDAQRRLHAHAFLEIDRQRDERTLALESEVKRMMIHRPAMHRAAPAARYPLTVHRVAAVAHRPRVMAHGVAARAGLQQQTVLAQAIPERARHGADVGLRFVVGRGIHADVHLCMMAIEPSPRSP